MAPLPYLPMSLEEVASVRCLDNWTNVKVRFIGRVTHFENSSCVGKLAAIGEGTEAWVRVSFTAVLDSIKKYDSQVGKLTHPGSVIQVLGTIEVHNNIPFVRAHIVRDYLGIDAEAYYRAVDRIQPYLPRNIKR